MTPVDLAYRAALELTYRAGRLITWALFGSERCECSIQTYIAVGEYRDSKGVVRCRACARKVPSG